LDASKELFQHADILSLIAILLDSSHIVDTDKRSGHNAAYYVRNKSIKMKTFVTTCFYNFAPLFFSVLSGNLVLIGHNLFSWFSCIRYSWGNTLFVIYRHVYVEPRSNMRSRCLKDP